MGARVYALAKATRLALPLKRVSYGQAEEDLALSRLFGSFSDGFYLDVGSGNPVHLSNTYLFYRMGWSGVCLDPLVANHQLARIIRPRGVNICALASERSGSLSFAELDPSFYSSTDLDVARGFIAGGAALVGIRDLPCVRISDLPFSVPSNRPSFFSIDVEGHKLQVLKGVDWTRQSPWFILIEMSGGETRTTIESEIVNLLKEHDYRLASQVSSHNFIFARSDAPTSTPYGG